MKIFNNSPKVEELNLSKGQLELFNLYLKAYGRVVIVRNLKKDKVINPEKVVEYKA